MLYECGVIFKMRSNKTHKKVVPCWKQVLRWMASCCCCRMSSTLSSGSSSARLADGVCRSHGSSSNGFEGWANSDDLKWEEKKTWTSTPNRVNTSIIVESFHSKVNVFFVVKPLKMCEFYLSCEACDSELCLNATRSCFSFVESSSIIAWRRSPSRLVLKNWKVTHNFPDQWRVVACKQVNSHLARTRQLHKTLSQTENWGRKLFKLVSNFSGFLFKKIATLCCLKKQFILLPLNKRRSLYEDRCIHESLPWFHGHVVRSFRKKLT